MTGALSTPLTSLTTVDEVIEALGGNATVQDMTAAKSLQTVTNWRYVGRCAHSTYLIMTDALKARGYTAPPELWGIKSAANDQIEPATQ
jgi:hypothetical protein